MIKTTRIALIAALLLNAAIFAQSDIPVETQAKILNKKISDAYKSKNYQAMISNIEQYRKLGDIFPNNLLFLEAQAAYLSGDSVRALTVLKEYLRTAKKTDPNYDDAIQLYPQLESNAATDSIKAFVAEIPSQMKLIPGGRFKMGTDFCTGLPPEKDNWKYIRCVNYTQGFNRMQNWLGPEHLVTVKPFKLQMRPIPLQTFKTFVRAQGIGDPDKPSADTVAQLVAYIGKVSGRKLRLPTEAEWTYAVMSGNDGLLPGTTEKPYPLDNTCASNNCHIFWYDIVVSHPNPFGLEFESGVNEITGDCWHTSFDGAPSDGAAWDLNNCPSGVRTLHPTNQHDTAFTRLPTGMQGEKPIVFRLAESIK